MPLNKSRVQEGWIVFEPVCSSPSIWECKVFWLLSASVFLVWALMHLTSPISPKFYASEPFSFPCYAQKFLLLSLALVCAFLLCPPTYPVIWVADTPLHPPNVNTQGVSAYLFSLAGEAAPFSEVGEHRDTPCIPHLLHIYCSLVFSPYISAWGTYGLTSVFEGMGFFSPAFPLVCSRVL